MICAIHQPNFFPWLGYFDKIKRADVFVFLDEVAYPKSGSGMGSWVNRVKVNVQGRATWVGCPVRRRPGATRICDAEIDDGQPWRRKFVRTLEMNYSRAPNFEEAMALLRPLIFYETGRLADFNIRTIDALTGHLGLRPKFVRQSDLGVPGAATELLIGITQAVGADIYLCGGGAQGYQEDALFLERGVRLQYQNFSPAPYGRPDRFLPGLSIIDYLMNSTDDAEKQ